MPTIEEPDRADRLFDGREINMVYTGAIYRAHYDAFHNLIAAIRRMKGPEIKLHLYTSQPESELKQKGISGNMVVYHPHVSTFEVPKVLRQSDILFLPLAFHSPIPEVIRTSAPGKTGEYLSVGRPVLVHAPKDSFISWFFRENHCGIVVDKDDPQVLSEEINKLISNDKMRMEISTNARTVAETQFSIDRMKVRFNELIVNLLEKESDYVTG